MTVNIQIINSSTRRPLATHELAQIEDRVRAALDHDHFGEALAGRANGFVFDIYLVNDQDPAIEGSPDWMGVYIRHCKSLQHNNTFLTPHKPIIKICPERVWEAAREDETNYGSLTVKVILHELAHAYMDETNDTLGEPRGCCGEGNCHFVGNTTYTAHGSQNDIGYLEFLVEESLANALSLRCFDAHEREYLEGFVGHQTDGYRNALQWQCSTGGLLSEADNWRTFKWWFIRDPLMRHVLSAPAQAPLVHFCQELLGNRKFRMPVDFIAGMLAHIDRHVDAWAKSGTGSIVRQGASAEPSLRAAAISPTGVELAEALLSDAPKDWRVSALNRAVQSQFLDVIDYTEAVDAMKKCNGFAQKGDFAAAKTKFAEFCARLDEDVRPDHPNIDELCWPEKLELLHRSLA